MQALAGLFCFSLLLATGSCLECVQCSGFKEDCTGNLEPCREGQDTCATILTETIIGKASSFTIVKSCYQASKCLSSAKGNSFIQVNVNVDCSSSPAGKVESKRPEHGSNELPNNQLSAEVNNQLKSRAAEVLNLVKFKAGVPTKEPESSAKPTETPTKKPINPPTKEPTKAPTKKPTKAPTKKPTKAPTKKPTKAPTKKPTKAPTKKPTKPPTKKPTTGDAHQTVASFLLAFSSLLLMNLFL